MIHYPVLAVRSVVEHKSMSKFPKKATLVMRSMVVPFRGSFIHCAFIEIKIEGNLWYLHRKNQNDIFHNQKEPWREIMDMIKYSSLRFLEICIHSNNANIYNLHEHALTCDLKNYMIQEKNKSTSTS